MLSLSISSYSQYNSRNWLNIKGEVKSLRQTKYQVGIDTLILEKSYLNRFDEMIFMSIGQQLLLDNSLLIFSRDGRVDKWVEFDNQNDTLIELKLTYADKLLPNKLQFLKKHMVTKTVEYETDSLGLFATIQTGELQLKISRDYKSRVISEIINVGDEQTKLIYEYLKDGTVRVHMIKNETLKNTLENTMNENGDFEFDGEYRYKYIYDKNGNWTSKTGYSENRPRIKFIREIDYF
jgi:hypothetical protein